MARGNNTPRHTQEKPVGAAAASPSSSPASSSQLFGRRVPAAAVLAPPLALCALVFIAFFPAVNAGFVWDDDAFTLAEPVAAWSGIAQIWFAPRSIHSEVHYWPVLYSTFWLEHKLWGFDPLGYHIVNLILHSAVTLLLWRLLARLKIPGAWFAAAVFAVHPVHTEPVVWVIGRKDVLAALFFLSAAWCYFNFVERHRHRDYTVALALFVVGMLSKSVVVTLPAALLVWHWWRRGGVTVADLKNIAPFIVIGVAVAVADWSYYAARETLATDHTLVERALIAAQALWFYAGKLFLPTELAVVYPHFTVGGIKSWMYLAAAAVPAVLWFARHRLGRGPLAGILFFALTLSPVLGLVDYGYMQFAFVADRYQYLAAAGVIVVVTAAAARLVDRVPAAKTVLPVAAAAVLTVFAALSWQQARIYQNAGAFFSHIIAHNPAAKSAHYNLGNYLQGEARFEEALRVYAVAERQDPLAANIHANTAVALEKLGRRDEAVERLRRALQLQPNDITAMNNLATLLNRQRRHAEALALYRNIVNIHPASAKAHSGMSVALFALGEHAGALRSLNRALKLQPDLQEAKAIRAKLLQLIGDE